MHPPEFVGEGDPDRAENGIRNLEKIFKTVGLNDEMKLLHATFRLENDAACWWEMIDSKGTAAQTVRTWELFKTEFHKNYISLRQSDGATKFTSLARHASYLVEGEDRRAKKFQDGLKPEIQEKTSILNIDDYYEMVERALLTEKSDGDIQRKRARLSGTRPNLSNWQGGRNLNIGGNKVRMADIEASSSGKDADSAFKEMYVILGRMVSCLENQQNNNLNHRGSNHDLEGQGQSNGATKFTSLVRHASYLVEGKDGLQYFKMRMKTAFRLRGLHPVTNIAPLHGGSNLETIVLMCKSLQYIAIGRTKEELDHVSLNDVLADWVFEEEFWNDDDDKVEV
ncbi:hypothetical protein RJ640_022185 [Escallonia rubra]|uniref:Retrotransposon gag domain-containing protein n=1 Tax=Escallonia rubra TaxID=112253 RepID=A0AA88QS13_9ASTE|nr:hypothetical protein RJ640_022185 [Escallonia rubra]